MRTVPMRGRRVCDQTFLVRTSLLAHVTHFVDRVVLACPKKVQRTSCGKEPKLLAKDDLLKIRWRKTKAFVNEVRTVSELLVLATNSTRSVVEPILETQIATYLATPSAHNVFHRFYTRAALWPKLVDRGHLERFATLSIWSR